MANVFLSYNRRSAEAAKNLANDIEALGHSVWFDHELSGGQTWWDQILASIRGCDVLVFVVEPAALESTACKREYGYAADLGKPILPVMVAEGISTNLLPPALSRIQLVDYRRLDRETALRLARAFVALPPGKPLPDPLPPPPEAPLSYLGGLTEQIESSATLTYQQQSTLVIDLRKSLRDTETADDARTLLGKLRKRHDLFATMADEIDELLESASTAPAPRAEATEAALREQSQKANQSPVRPESAPPETDEARQSATTSADRDGKSAMRGRLIGALLGGVLGLAIGVVSRATGFDQVRLGIDPGLYYWLFDNTALICLIPGTGGVIGGALSGTQRRNIGPSLLGAAVGWSLVAMFYSAFLHFEFAYSFALGGIFGAPTGAIVGAIGDGKPGIRERRIGALLGGVLGLTIGVLSLTTASPKTLFFIITRSTSLIYLIPGTGGVIGGALGGTRRRDILPSLLGTAVGWFLVAMIYLSWLDGLYSFALGGIFGAPTGAIVGPIAAKILRRNKKT